MMSTHTRVPVRSSQTGPSATRACASSTSSTSMLPLNAGDVTPPPSADGPLPVGPLRGTLMQDSIASMAHLFGQQWTRAALLERVGDVSQLGGARLLTLAEGPESGVSVAELRTGSGLSFNVLPGRGMDIGFAEYKGMPLCWRSSTGEIAAAHYEPQGDGWLRGFSGGLIVPCRMTTAGCA